MRIPRRLISVIYEIWILQYRLANLHRYSRRIHVLFHHQRFRAAYDFLVLRSEAGEPVAEACAWWAAYQNADESERRKMIQQIQRRKK